MVEKDELVQLARNGDQQAFGDLVQKHRAKAIDWAQSITHDPYLAEDVVQDTILRSYIYLKQLKHTDRFLPWFRQMVRNRAIDYVRKHQKVSSMSEDYFQNIDGTSDDPEQWLENQEWLSTFNSLLSSLSKRDQQIFECHFLKQIPPSQIAQQFGIQTSNVYNIISRAKVKLQDEAFNKEVKKFVQGRNGKKILKTPNVSSSYVSLGHLLQDFFPFITNQKYSIAHTMGFTGQAFRIQVARDIGLSSSLIYDWDWVIRRIAESLNLKVKTVGKPGKVPTPDLLSKTLRMIHESIDDGMPAIVWNLATSEFGLVYGYDLDTGTFTYRNAVGSNLFIPYEKLGRTSQLELFVATFKKKSLEPDMNRMVNHLLNHADGKEPSVDGYVSGLTAYDYWIEAFQNNEVDTVGHAYQIAQLTEAREHAVHFLKQSQICKEAEPYFRTALENYKKLYPTFPYGLPGINLDISNQTIKGLRQIKDAEMMGYEKLRKNL